MKARTWLGVVLVGGVMALGGCGSIGGGSPRLVSAGSLGGVLNADLPTRFYTSTDRNTGDFYLTNLPDSLWKAGADPSAMEGVIVHVHMFMSPKAGRTPIATTANSCTVRVLVLSQGQLGMFGGGGYLTKSGTSGLPTLGASVADSSLRLMRATPGFSDALGPSVFTGSFTCPRDEAQARLMSRAIGSLLTATTPVTPEPIVDESPAPTP